MRKFDPLDKRNLGVSVADALLNKNACPMPPAKAFVGAGVYGIYYRGDFHAYAPVSQANKEGKCEVPIYVGKAVPAGARKGGFGLDISPGMVTLQKIIGTCQIYRSGGQSRPCRLLLPLSRG